MSEMCDCRYGHRTSLSRYYAVDVKKVTPNIEETCKCSKFTTYFSSSNTTEQVH